MAFVTVNRNDVNAVYAGDLVQVVNSLNTLYALIERTEERMQEMDNAQIEELYGVTGFGSVVKNQVVSALNVLEAADGPMEKLRTQLG